MLYAHDRSAEIWDDKIVQAEKLLERIVQIEQNVVDRLQEAVHRRIPCVRRVVAAGGAEPKVIAFLLQYDRDFPGRK